MDFRLVYSAMQMIAQAPTEIARQTIVYVVDDDAEVRDSIAFMLETEGIASRAFDGAGDLLDKLAMLAPGCLLVDLRMPGMDGFDLLAELARRGCHWPVVAMSGNDARDLTKRACALGAMDFIAKPFDIDLLLVCLRRASRLVKG